MEFKDRKKLFEKACKDLSKEDLVMYLHGLIEILDHRFEVNPEFVILLSLSASKILSQMELTDAEATHTISAHLKSEFQAFAQAKTETN